MINAEVRREAIERLGPGVDQVQPEQVYPDGELHPETVPYVEALWEAWITSTLTLLAFGFTHRALCDAAGEMASLKTEAKDRIFA